MDLPFESLPAGLQARVREALAGEPPEGTHVARLDSRGRTVALAALTAAVALAILAALLLAPLELPLPARVGVTAAVLVAGLLAFAARQAAPLLATRASRLRPLALATNDLFLVVRHDGQSVTLRRIRELRNAVVASSWSEVRFADDLLILPLVDPATPTLTHFLRHQKENLPEYKSAAEEEVEALEADPPGPAPGGRGERAPLGPILAAAAVGVALALVAWAIGARRVEGAAFEQAVLGPRADDAAKYRFYATRAKERLGSWSWLTAIDGHVARADALVEERRADEAHTALELRSFLMTYPKNPRADELRAREDDVAYEEAHRKGDVDSFAGYRTDHPSGRHRAAADDAAFDTAKKTVAGLDRYRSLFGGGRHQAEVEPARAALFEAAAVAFEAKGAGGQELAAAIRWLAAHPGAGLSVFVRDLERGSYAKAAAELAAKTPGLEAPGKDLDERHVYWTIVAARDALATAVTEALPPGLVSIRRGEGVPDPNGVSLALDFRLLSTGPVGATLTTPPLDAATGSASVRHITYAGLRVEATAALHVPGVAPLSHAFAGEPTENFERLPGDPDRGGVYGMVVESGLEAVSRQTRVVFGLEAPSPGKSGK